MKRNQSGFTLIEIAIVLVIIGLLIGGVLKGQELINSAKVKNLATDFKNIPVFIYGYQDKFKALPGDDKTPLTHLGAPVTDVVPTGGQTLGNGIIEGPWVPTALTDETLLFWQHIRVAGLAPGPTTLALTGFLPTNASGGNVGVQSGSNSPITGLRGTYIICSAGILGKFVTQLDTTMDDGKPNTGSMMALSLSAAPAAATTIDETLTYTVCMGV